jgi:hypothetical protein
MYQYNNRANMFNTFESTESRWQLYKKKREKNKRREKKLKELYTINIKIVLLFESYTIKVDSRKLLKDLYNIITADEKTISGKNYQKLVIGNNKILFENYGRLKLSDARDIETLTIADFFNITNKQLEDPGWSLPLWIILGTKKK